jgi:enoyl-CoA hydratase/carnithine racemase
MSESFQRDLRDGVLTVVFNRPDRLNAFRRAEYTRLLELLNDIERDSAVRVVVLTGAGRGFCAGEDLKELASSLDPRVDKTWRDNVLILQDITRRIARSSRPYIAAVNGVAAGFGAEVACACDLRLASTTARFLFPEVKRGLFVTNGISYILPRLVGDTWARTLLLTGEPVDAETALRIGLVTELVPEGEVAARGRALAATIAARAPTAVRLTKQILGGDQALLERALAEEVESIAQCIASGEPLEGARAFVEKRAPRFRVGP